MLKESSLIKRPGNLVYVPVYLVFNNRLFESLEIDLEHINKNNRSHFSDWDISNVVLRALQNKRMEPSDRRKYGIQICSYFETQVIIFDAIFMLIVCVCTDKPDTLGVITFYRIGKNNEPIRY